MTTDKDLDRMYEAALAQDWEELNAGNYPEWDEAAQKIKTADALLAEAKDLLEAAAGLVEGSAEEDLISSLADEIGFLGKDLEKQTERMKKTA